MEWPLQESGLVILASRQILPAVESIIHMQTKKRLREVLILHTNDFEQSVRPAKTLEALCKTISVDCHTVPVDMHDRLVAELAKLDSSWIINATGGTKLMAFRIYDRAKAKALPIVYREIQEGWYCILWDEGKAVVSPWPVPGDLHDKLSLPTWIALAMMVDPEKLQATDIKESEMVEPAAIQSALNHYGWNWIEALRAVDRGHNKAGGHGTAFERYIAQTLRSQTRQVALNVKLKHSENDTVLLESDVVCKAGNRIYLFDCKLDNSAQTSPVAVVQQIEQAHTRVRSLGGLASRCVLLRPTWHNEVVDLFRDYAARLNVELWAYQDMANLFEKISKLFGSDANGTLAEAQRTLDQAPRPLFGLRSERAYATETSRGNLVFNAVDYFTHSVREIGFGMIWHDGIELGTVDKASIVLPDGQDKLVKILENRGYEIAIGDNRIKFGRVVAGAGKSYAEETAKAIRRYLRQHERNHKNVGDS